MSTLSFSEKCLVRRSSTVIGRFWPKTYALLLISVVMASVGGYSCSHSGDAVVFPSPGGLDFGARAAQCGAVLCAVGVASEPSLGIVALAADGFISGIALGPLLAIANYLSPGTIPAALAVTGGVFVAVTGYVMFSRKKFSAPAGLLTGMFFALIIAMFVNSFLQLSGLGLLITIGIGIFGVVSLVYATSDVLNNPSYDNPVQGALMLFAALFNIFVCRAAAAAPFSSRD